jgi:UV DNA damage endonuclease
VLAQLNAQALRAALTTCRRLQIRAFRITSGLMPLATHPDFLYGVDELSDETRALYEQAGSAARADDIRLSFHPDQFVLLGSPVESVITNSLRELELQGRLAELLGADVINLHAGGSYGDKKSALDRVVCNLGRLTPATRSRLTLENDDRIYTVADLLPLCRAEGVPLTYDVHHHRCNPDGLSVEEATGLALATWDREALFHVSSPRDGWKAANPRAHADYIDVVDFPRAWLGLTMTVDVEAKAKEDAVLDLRKKMAALRSPLAPAAGARGSGHRR